MPARTAVKLKWLFVPFFMLQGYVALAQLKADFTANITSGCSPIVVKFTDISAGNPTNWKWDLGNGTISFLRNPSVTYFAPGQYDIKLIISNSGGKDSIIKMQYLTVNANPSPAFSASATTGCFPLAIKLTDASLAGSGAISKWEWDFGDGISSADSSPEHIYKAPGSFNVSLRLTNSLGCTKSLTKPKYIQISTGVLAGFDIKMSNTCKAPATINFTNTSTGVGNLSYQWDFGDGTGSALATPSHTYLTNGNYNVRLILSNSTGCTDTLTKVNAIILGNINADFTIPATVCQGRLVSLKNTSTPVTSGVTWYFGDGSSSSDSLPLKKYSSPGNYIVKMVADFGACLDSVSRPITVMAIPSIKFSADKTKDCQVPFTVNFSQNTNGGVSYFWDFGDSASSVDHNPTHVYNKPGNYTVKLIVSNAAGCSDTLIKPAFIQIQPPSASILLLPAMNCAPFNLKFTSKVTTVEAVVSYRWNFGDGSLSSEVSPAHTFTEPGKYDITLIVTTTSGCTDTITVVNGVIVGARPVALFSAAPRNDCARVPVSFQDLSTGTIDKWNWLFGDGGTSAQQNPTHVYTDTGYFNVTLIVINNGCADTIKIDNYVHIKPPIASFLVAYNCALPLQRLFTNTSIGADTLLWDFGDGATSTLADPVHNYASQGTYTVKLTASNAASGCTYTKPQTFVVVAEKAKFSVSDSVVCKGSPLNFQAININPSNISSYAWNFGDGTPPGSGRSLTHIYKLAGSYTVRLIIKDILGCSDTLLKPLYIQVDGPTAVFTQSVPGTCLNNAITFIDSSFSDGRHNILQWRWNYGDGKKEILSAPPFQHSYSSAGIYTVSLKVVDSKGCSDSLGKPNALVISKPVANFSSNNTVSCPLKPVTFTNLSIGPKLTFLWDFGDGSTSSQINPVHQYAAEGLFSISVAITDQYGCTDYRLKKDYIKIIIPLAKFSMSDSFTNCPPLIVKFTNLSSNTITKAWDFGDGTTSLENDPSHFYGFAGVYNVILKVTSPGGCIDSTTKQITVKGPSGTFNYLNIIGCNPLTTNFKASTKNTSSIIWDFNDGTLVTTSDAILSHKYIDQGIYLPKIILVDDGGCHVPVEGKDTIVVYGIQANFAASPVTLCDSGAVKFTDNSTSNNLITSFFWNFNDGNSSREKNPLHTYTKSGLYDTKLVVETQSGCKDSITLEGRVKVIASPKIAIVSSIGACIPAVLNFSGSVLVADTSDLAWTWDFKNGNTSTLQNPPDQTYILPDSYVIQLTATNSSNCISTVAKTVKAFPLPPVRIIADSIVCKGSQVRLLAQGAALYSWSPGNALSCTTCANPVSRPDSSVKYLVAGTSTDGCIAKDSLSLSVKFPFALQVSNKVNLCVGSSTLLSAGGAEKYSWSPSTGLSNSISPTTVAAPLQTTTYRVIASDNIGCFKDTGYIPVTVYPIPVVDAGPDKTINVGKTIDLVPVISNDVTRVNWSPTSGIFRNSYPGIAVKPNETLEYTVEVSNTGGCLSRDRVTVNVLCNNANVFVPNTFSPNADGANDIFYPRGSGLFRVKILKVFNRWGEVVFEKSNIAANDITAGWDGTSNNKKLLPDVFVYIMDIVCDNNTTLTFKGNITLLR